jgi:hypothetical protein
MTAEEIEALEPRKLPAGKAIGTYLGGVLEASARLSLENAAAGVLVPVVGPILSSRAC